MWCVVVSVVIHIRGSIKCGEFLGWLRTGWLLKKDSAAWSGLGKKRVEQFPGSVFYIEGGELADTA
jgi:hypothetical protein